MVFRKLALLTAWLFMIFFLLTSLAELRSFNWDWDIDHRMYFGSRLLHGELIWTREYDDKLPLMQFLFAIPALARSVRVWQLMSMGMILSAAYGLYVWLKNRLRRDWRLTAGQSKRIALLSACLYPYLIAILPGSISHHNASAASFFTLGLIAAVPFKDFNRAHRPTRAAGITRFWIAAMLMAVAISLRPYFLVPALLVAPWRTLGGRLRVDRPLRSKALARSLLWQSILWTAAIGLLGLLLNVLPYVLSGNLTAFLNGLSMLSQETVPFQLGSMLRIQLERIFESKFFAFFAFSLPPLLCIGVLIQFTRSRQLPSLPIHWSRTQALDILFVCLLMPASLEWMILYKHYFPHYQQLFTPLATLAFAFFLASLTQSWKPRTLQLTPRQSGILATFCTVLLLAAFSRSLSTSVPALLHPPLEGRLASYTLLGPTGKNKGLGESFLAPSSMYLHWKLDQSRHGFPHAAMTGFIHDGFWEKATRPSSLGFQFPISATEYCEQLINNGPQEVIDTATSPSIQCLKHDGQAIYVKSREFKLLSGGPDLHLYVRRTRSVS
jgi:hypothetical protein